GLQLWCIRHGKARAVDLPGAVTSPACAMLDLWVQGIADVFEQVFEQGQGQAHPGGTIGAGSEAQTGQARQRGTSRIAVKNLQQKNVDRSCWIEDAVAPRVVQVAADLGNGFC